MAKGTEKALGLLGSSLTHSGSQASLSLWEPRKRTLDPLPNRVPEPRLHKAIQMMMIMAAAEYLLNARHPHTIF